MNRITQCLHGKGTISSMMGQKKNEEVQQQFLAYAQVIRPVIFWNLTGRCNLSCTHCYNASGPEKRTTGELSTDEALSFIDDCAGLRVPVILLSGGEPLMREDLWQLAAHATSLGIKTALSSNGTLITPEIACRIRDAGIGYVGISLDGASADTHDRFRNVHGAFDRTVLAFQYCRDAGVRCGVRITLNRQNHHELEALINLALEIGASRFCVYWLVPSGRGTGPYQDIQINEAEVMTALDILHRYAEKIDPSVMEFLTVDAPQDAVHLLEMMERNRSGDLSEARSLLSSMKGGCSAGVRVANVNPEGDIFPCQFAQSPEFRIGSVKDRLFSEIWNDPKNPILKMFRNKQDLLTGRCKSCTYLDLCGGGCRIRAYRQGGEIGDEDPFCFVRSGSSDLNV